MRAPDAGLRTPRLGMLRGPVLIRGQSALLPPPLRGPPPPTFPLRPSDGAAPHPALHTTPAGSPLLRSVPAFAGLPPCHWHDGFASRTGCSPRERGEGRGVGARPRGPHPAGLCPATLPLRGRGHASVSSQIVTGPSLTRATFMSAAKMPLAVVTPWARRASEKCS